MTLTSVILGDNTKNIKKEVKIKSSKKIMTTNGVIVKKTLAARR